MFSMSVFALFFKDLKYLKIPLLAKFFFLVENFVFIALLLLVDSHHAHFMFVRLF